MLKDHQSILITGGANHAVQALLRRGWVDESGGGDPGDSPTRPRR